MLFIGPLPEPVTGQSLACRVLLEGLPKTFRVDLVNLSKEEFRQGVSSWSRVGEVVGILWRVWQKGSSADVIYLTVSESLAGNLKDLVIYALCFRRLHLMAIHLHGGAGMRLIMRRGHPLRAVNAFFLRRLGAAIVLGASQRDIYSGVVPEARIHVVPNFAEDGLFTTFERIEAKFARLEPLRVLFLSNLLPGKGHEELIDAFMALEEHTKAAIRLDFAGGFESEQQKEKFVAKVTGEAQIHYHGTVAGQRKRDLFHQAHVFCLPTYYPYEGQPISLLEAYASGCAVVTTDHSGIPDVFADGVNGFQVAKQSSSEITMVLERALHDSGTLRQIATTNLRTALVHYRTAEYQHAVTQVIDLVGRQ